jgi:hypothetical protein
MEKLKVIHDEQGDHNPLASRERAKITGPYELRGATLKFITFELNRGSTHAVWRDTDTGKRYRTDVRHLEDAINGDLKEGEVSMKGGCYIYGDFEFKQSGQHVLLCIKESFIDVHVELAHTKSILSGILNGTLKGRALKTEVKIYFQQTTAPAPEPGK